MPKIIEKHRAENSSNAKLDWEKVSDIRTRRLSRSEFVALYDVTESTIRAIQNGRTWVPTRVQQSWMKGLLRG